MKKVKTIYGSQFRDDSREGVLLILSIIAETFAFFSPIIASKLIPILLIVIDFDLIVNINDIKSRLS